MKVGFLLVLIMLGNPDFTMLGYGGIRLRTRIGRRTEILHFAQDDRIGKFGCVPTVVILRERLS